MLHLGNATAAPQCVTAAGQNTALAGFRAFLFYSWTLLLSVPLFVIMLVQAPFTLLFDKVR